MTDTLSDKIVEAGALAILNVKRQKHGFPPLLDMTLIDAPFAEDFHAEARAYLTATLTAAEAEGVVLCVVPGTPPFKGGVYGNGYMDGATDYRAATLAGKVTL
jgi:hypothetical protein